MGKDVFARNHLAFDLGLPWLDESKISESIAFLDSTLNLVVLADYFKESMVLLRSELCWEWEDVLFFAINQSSQKKPISEKLGKNGENDRNTKTILNITSFSTTNERVEFVRQRFI